MITSQRCWIESLSSLRDFLSCLDDLPSHKWLGYFQQKNKAGCPDIDAFEAMMMREDCEKGFFVSFDYSDDALREIESFFKRSHKVIIALTVQEILDEHMAKKLA